MSRFVHLVRHAVYRGHGEGRFLGRRDVDLSPSGEAQARRLRPLLADLRPVVYCCSPARRCRQTLALALPEAVAAGAIMPELQEMDFGEWEGLTFVEMAERDPPRVARWASFDPDFAFPGGESLAGFLERVQAAATQLVARPEEHVVVFAHGGVIRALLCQFLGLTPRDYLLFAIEPAGVVTVELFGEHGVLTRLLPSPDEEL